jgi:hypothetical protein
MSRSAFFGICGCWAVIIYYYYTPKEVGNLRTRIVICSYKQAFFGPFHSNYMCMLIKKDDVGAGIMSEPRTQYGGTNGKENSSKPLQND